MKLIILILIIVTILGYKKYVDLKTMLIILLCIFVYLIYEITSNEHFQSNESVQNVLSLVQNGYFNNVNVTGSTTVNGEINVQSEVIVNGTGGQTIANGEEIDIYFGKNKTITFGENGVTTPGGNGTIGITGETTMEEIQTNLIKIPDVKNNPYRIYVDNGAIVITSNNAEEMNYASNGIQYYSCTQCNGNDNSYTPTLNIQTKGFTLNNQPVVTNNASFNPNLNQTNMSVADTMVNSTNAVNGMFMGGFGANNNNLFTITIQ